MVSDFSEPQETDHSMQVTFLRRVVTGLAIASLGLTSTLLQAQTPKKVLVVTVTKGFRHSSIPTAEQVLEKLARESGAFVVDFVRNDEEMAVKMTPVGLKNYDGFIFANTTGLLPLPDKVAFLNEVKVAGKAFIGMHSASDTFHGQNVVDPFIELLGGEFQGHGAQVGVECLVTDREHPSTRHLGEAYCIEKEEIYLIKNYDRTKVRDLLILDKHPNRKRERGHFPVTWCKTAGAGKVFYTTLGHREDVWENPLYQKHILGGIKWALGLEAGESAPLQYP
jgi:type 1 glutamine amidotransferase